jgi:quercetin dioxygenase-like cupin family protein
MILALLLAAAIGITPDAVVWKDGPPPLPAGARLAPHWHPRDERVTILSGAAELGFGATADRKATKRYDAGSFYVNPPRTMHYLYFPEETVMQMTGVGPWELFTTHVEAK